MRLFPLLAVLLTLGLTSCDSAIEPASSASDTFSVVPLAPGASLFGTSGKTAGGPTFGCYASSPNPGAPESERYLHGGYVLTFPDEVVARAGGRYAW